ncbi:MAG TPA: hypothetical protein VIK60_09985 [Vicinamibacterales bacterium]
MGDPHLESAVAAIWDRTGQYFVPEAKSHQDEEIVICGPRHGGLAGEARGRGQEFACVRLQSRIGTGLVMCRMRLVRSERSWLTATARR